jgi:hypothetical protein
MITSWTRFGAGPAARKALIDCVSVCFGSSRCAALKNLDHPKQTALCPETMRASSVESRAEVKRSGTSLDATELAPDNRGTVLVDQNGHQNRS